MIAAVLTLALTALATTPVPEVVEGQLTTRSMTGSLAAEVERFTANHNEPAWLGWAVPAAQDTSTICCDTGHHCVCSFEGRHRGMTARHDVDSPSSPWLLVLLRADRGAVARIQLAGGQCTLDAGGRSITWLEGVSPEESIAFLAGVAEARARIARNVDPDSAIVAIALHNHSAAGDVLEQLTEPGHERDTREQAAFWLSHSQGARGFQVVNRLLRDDTDSDFREHLTFALSQSSESGAIDELLRLARGDRDPEVRQQALFWLAQEAGERALASLSDAIEDDPDLEVRKHALFALTQVQKGDGVPLLMQVARGDYHPELRRQALFWLGQSGDSRALDYIEELITR